MLKNILIGAVLLFPAASAQQTPTVPGTTTAATNLDSFLSQTGVLTVRESLGTKIISAQYTGVFELEAVRLYTPGKEKSAISGIAFKVNSGDKYASTSTQFIEYSEIDDMINAVNYMSLQAPKANTKVEPEFRFTSKSNAIIGMFFSLSTGGFNAFVKSGTQTVFLDLDALKNVSQALTELKSALK